MCTSKLSGPSGSLRRCATGAASHVLIEGAKLGPRVLDHPESETSLRELRRVAVDLEHYRQRLHDLVYDAVALELGGSE